ncbi:hypothetical protein BGZ46_001522 [Entomortierella lignicola]|nr:hypothetical protein BGZ46_001522 [Entomortierella lignicola]
MDTFEHSSQPSILPSKLRWRPYNNGGGPKAKKSKKDDYLQEHSTHQQSGQSLDPKALVHRLKMNTQSTPSVVQLQWEEAETIESMSHGGHPHTQQYYRNQYPSQRQSTPSDVDSESTISSTSRRQSMSIPSPPSSVSSTSRLNFLGCGETQWSDLSILNAAVPGITGDDFLNHSLALPKIEDNTCYQAALSALLENHRKNQILDAQAPALALTSVPVPMSVASPPLKLSERSMRYPLSPLISDGGCSSKRKLSTSELLGIVNIDDLLASCGYTDEPNSILAVKPEKSIFASPSASDRSSVNSSPIESTVSLLNPESFSPVTDISAAYFDMLMTQTPVLLAEGDSKQLLHQQQQQQQQRQQYQSDSSPALSTASTITNAFAEIISDFASPFVSFSALKVPLASDDSVSSWPSLFPNTQEEVNSINEILQEEGINNLPPNQPIQNSSLLTHPGATQDLDPEWLSFLDDSSPILSSTDVEPGMESVPESTSSLNQPVKSQSATTPPTSPSARDGGFVASWAKGVLQTSALSPTGHRAIPSAGPISSMGSGGSNSGSLTRALHGGNAQKKSEYHTKNPTKSITGSTSIIEDSTKPSLQLRPKAAGNNTDQSGVSLLVALFRGLWKGGERDQ